MKRNALLSVFSKDGITEFAQELLGLDFDLYASGGTAKHLLAAGLPVVDVATIVGEPILGHRVVTLSREIHAGLLSEDTPDDNAELQRIGVPRFDLVCVDLYPLKEAITNDDATEESVKEKTDIGGPAMLRAAAKGRRIVVSLPEQRQKVLDWLKAGEPDRDTALRAMAGAAEMVCACYAMLSGSFLMISPGDPDESAYDVTTQALIDMGEEIDMLLPDDEDERQAEELAAASN